MNVREHTWDEKNPVSYDKDGKEYEWYEKSFEFMYCRDEGGKVYALDQDDGTLVHIPGKAIAPHWYRAFEEEVLQSLEMAQKRKVA